MRSVTDFSNKSNGGKLIIRLLISLLLISYNGETIACQMACPPINKRFEESNVAFFGKVIKIEYLETDTLRNEPRIKVYFDVKKQWKGQTKDTIVETVRNRFSCDGYAFHTNRVYLVLTKKQKDKLIINVCSVLLKNDDNLAIINALFGQDQNN